LLSSYHDFSDLSNPRTGTGGTNAVIVVGRGWAWQLAILAIDHPRDKTTTTTTTTTTPSDYAKKELLPLQQQQHL